MLQAAVLALRVLADGDQVHVIVPAGLRHLTSADGARRWVEDLASKRFSAWDGWMPKKGDTG